MPGRLMCFVCGSPGAESTVRIRQYEREPYFPFLAHHDPPKGSRLPTADGNVDSCRVCYMFLTQQWDSYERSNTPAVKRLYWLKRADNGTFTGAEMRIQGEYIAQVMGLQYPPGFDDGGSPENSNLNSEREYAKSMNSSNPQMYAYQNMEKIGYKSNSEMMPKDSALDLSTPKKESDKHHNHSGEGSSKRALKDRNFACYVCGQVHPFSDINNYVNTFPQQNEPFFPVLKNIAQAPGSDPLTRRGQILVCSNCKNYLFQQWQAYEMSGTPMSHRHFKVPGDHVENQREHEPVRKSVIKSEEKHGEDDQKHVFCYICGNSYVSEHVRLLNTLPSKRSSPTSMFFPFVRELKRPPHAEPMRSDGSVISCIKCFGHLSYQWEIQEVDGVPLYHRQYSLQFLSNKENESEKVPSSAASSRDQIQPLNIQISTTSPMQSSQNSNTDFPTTQGLLAIATPQSESIDSRSVSRNSEVTGSPLKSLDADPKLSTSESNSMVKTVPHPLQQVCEIPKKVCFLCAERCIIHKMKFLHAYPARHEAKHTNSQVGPYFPFLTNCTPAQGSDAVTEDGIAIVCKLCYYSLLKQWTEYESSSNPSDSNRWLRKYTIPTYVCYVCGIENERKFMRSISVNKFHFLREHSVPKGALIIDEGQKVVVCKSCAYSLMEQFAEYERMGVPLQLRKFNWKQRLGSAAHDSTGEDDSQDISKFEVSRRRTSTDKDLVPAEGAPPGSKPTALNMMSPAGSKIQRNTATVSPLHHVTSPTNGVTSVGANAALNASRTSSFAAALRKLANQAKDGPEEGVVKSSSANSPRDTISKSGPPPLVYTSTTLTSPPVVTIAPTQSHPSLLASDSRPTLERLHSSSSMFETVSGKSDRPHSSASREEDRASSRDTHSQSARRMTPHSTPGTVSPMSAREEGFGRGFQPYRPGDDLRHPLPSSLALDQAAAAAAAAYSYPAAFLPPHAFPHPAFRFDDPILLERYRMMQSPYLPYPQNMLSHPSLHPLLAAGGRYPAELFPPQFAPFTQSSRMPDHRSPSLMAERQRIEEEKQRELEREKEKEREKERELALQREKQRMLERETEKRERERLAQRELERRASLDKSRMEMSVGDRVEDSLARFGSVIQGTPKGLGIADRYPRVSSSSSLSGRKDERRHSRDEYSFGHSHSRSAPQKSYSDEMEKRCSLVNPLREGDRIRPPPLISPQSQDDNQSRSSKTETGLFRPFDSKQLPNGFEKHSSDKKDRDRDRDRDKLFHYRAEVEDKKYSHERSSYTHDKDTQGSELLSNNRFGSLSSAFHSLDNHSSKTSTVSSLSASRSQSHITPGLSSKSPAHLGLPHSVFSTPLNVPSYSAGSTPSASTGHSAVSLCVSSSPSTSSNSMKLGTESQFQSQPCVSKLDLEEKRRGESHMDKSCCSDSECDYSSDEEHTVYRKLLISSGPPLQLDTAPKKIELFNQLGLTTLKAKRDKEFEKLRKHRRKMRERSLTPVSVEDDASSLSPLKTPYQPEDICQEPDYRHKCNFLSYFYGLEPVSPESRKVNDYMRKVCEAEQRRRLNVSESQDVPSISNNTGVKRKLGDMNSRSSDPNKNIMSSLKRRDTKSSTNPGDGKTLNIPQFSTSLSPCSPGQSLTDRANKATASQKGSNFLAKSFVQEFHESVLQTTRQKEMSRHFENQEEAHKRLRMDPSFYDRLQSTSTFRYPGIADWPGIETVMENYHRHQQGEKLERQVLIERKNKLKEENSELNKTAERLSRRMEELLQSKRHLEDLRNHNQDRIDSLKSTMKKLK